MRVGTWSWVLDCCWRTEDNTLLKSFSKSESWLAGKVGTLEPDPSVPLVDDPQLRLPGTWFWRLVGWRRTEDKTWSKSLGKSRSRSGDEHDALELDLRVPLVDDPQLSLLGSWFGRLTGWRRTEDKTWSKSLGRSRSKSGDEHDALEIGPRATLDDPPMIPCRDWSWNMQAFRDNPVDDDCWLPDTKDDPANWLDSLFLFRNPDICVRGFEASSIILWSAIVHSRSSIDIWFYLSSLSSLSLSSLSLYLSLSIYLFLSSLSPVFYSAAINLQILLQRTRSAISNSWDSRIAEYIRRRQVSASSVSNFGNSFLIHPGLQRVYIEYPWLPGATMRGQTLSLRRLTCHASLKFVAGGCDWVRNDTIIDGSQSWLTGYEFKKTDIYCATSLSSWIALSACNCCDGSWNQNCSELIRLEKLEFLPIWVCS